jgi:hypothetical protein
VRKDAKLKIKAGYDDALVTSSKFDGMMNPLSIALFEAFLQFQKAHEIHGDMIEFGVFRGKSASLILRKLNAGEMAYLVDVTDYPELEKLAEISDQFKFLKGKSENLLQEQEFLDSISAQVRFSHHDASHSYVNVMSEMEAMAHRISPMGLMVLDDYGNPSYMQVVAASFTYLSRSDSPLEVLLYANNKAYLCRKEDFPVYARFVVHDLISLLKDMGHQCYVTRTDNNPAYRGFSIAAKTRPDQPDRYGEHIYGDVYYRV